MPKLPSRAFLASSSIFLFCLGSAQQGCGGGDSRFGDDDGSDDDGGGRSSERRDHPRLRQWHLERRTRQQRRRRDPAADDLAGERCGEGQKSQRRRDARPRQRHVHGHPRRRPGERREVVLAAGRARRDRRRHGRLRPERQRRGSRHDHRDRQRRHRASRRRGEPRRRAERRQLRRHPRCAELRDVSGRLRRRRRRAPRRRRARRQLAEAEDPGAGGRPGFVLVPLSLRKDGVPAWHPRPADAMGVEQNGHRRGRENHVARRDVHRVLRVCAGRDRRRQATHPPRPSRVAKRAQRQRRQQIHGCRAHALGRRQQGVWSIQAPAGRVAVTAHRDRLLQLVRLAPHGPRRHRRREPPGRRRARRSALDQDQLERSERVGHAASGAAAPHPADGAPERQEVHRLSRRLGERQHDVRPRRHHARLADRLERLRTQPQLRPDAAGGVPHRARVHRRRRQAQVHLGGALSRWLVRALELERSRAKRGARATPRSGRRPTARRSPPTASPASTR